ncbi:PREDICTED: uncharacterized protein LOC104811873 [Tarenaya hassleriana]|uniref:uncharacterized protein LOC104811873 n=1 Tax=Tarenaya hassleriana TaxID=28532 RepID=UPI00053C25B3|nr:PREDICTED: uncharacterized protein LOC104811873 [Tarenaya hassleriana]
MVGSGRGGGGGGDRSKDAVGMMALHEALQSVCLNSDWTYSVFWTIRPRPRVRGGNGCKVGDDNGCLMLMWEDGFCRGRTGDCLEDIEGEDPVRRAFSKMSIQLYNYGEGLMGKVASDKCHKWVFKEPSECEPNVSNYWQSSFDALPPEWTDQFESGIQTIAVIQAGHGLLQLGSCKIIQEDLHFVLRMRHTFESLGYQSGFYLSQLFSSNRTSPSPSSVPAKPFSLPNQQPPPPVFNWAGRTAGSLLPSPSFHDPSATVGGFMQEGTAQILPTSHDNSMMEENENDIKWPNGLSLFDALTSHVDESTRLLFNHPASLEGKELTLNPNRNEFSSLDSDSHHPKMETKFRRSYTMPPRMDTSSPSASFDQHQPLEFRNPDAGMFSDVMETLR